MAVIIRMVPGSLSSADVIDLQCSPGKHFMLCKGCGAQLDFWCKYASHQPGCQYAPQQLEQTASPRYLRRRLADAWREFKA